MSDSEIYGSDPYDINFNFPLHSESLESERVRLTPFIPSVHGQLYWDNVSAHHDELFRHYPITHGSLAEFLAYVEKYYRRNPEFVMFAIIDKTRCDDAHPVLGGGSMAGVIALLRTSPTELVTEIGYVLVFQAFQRTHVAANAVGILMRYCLELPSASPPGLGLRRVQWVASPNNQGSIRLAQKMGFKSEGLMKWTRVLPQGVVDTRPCREGDPYFPRGGMDGFLMTVCWDDWESGERETVKRMINR
ncbi:uncharacterized protein FIBRA_07176 [Fibroporia radiculosa]|uniref:N-acetyltransferase domain-containing protein n=1 Tax=Fibroporia radiculosa TaxID=599839 RepID=J4GDP0_9APHY|nr:uncharacterized protein FIBRA_07176 [Fibroporia radiculosa]CCM04978.1 predicted protein [Fibroporia radiculosa]